MDAIGTVRNCVAWSLGTMDTVGRREEGKEPVSEHQIRFSLGMVRRRGGLERDGTAEPVSRGQNIRRERGQEIFILSA